MCARLHLSGGILFFIDAIIGVVAWQSQVLYVKAVAGLERSMKPQCNTKGKIAPGGSVGDDSTETLSGGAQKTSQQAPIYDWLGAASVSFVIASLGEVITRLALCMCPAVSARCTHTRTVLPRPVFDMRASPSCALFVCSWRT